MEQVSINRIQLLHPALRTEALQILRECDAALTGRAKVRITQTLRTFPEQAELYAQGRTKPGNIVTKANAGQSIHNYGLALDFCLVIDNKDISWDTKADWDNDRQSDWMEVVSIFKRHGWQWGGDWRTFTDMPHFEKTFGLTWQTCLDRYKAKDFIAGEYVRV